MRVSEGATALNCQTRDLIYRIENCYYQQAISYNYNNKSTDNLNIPQFWLGSFRIITQINKPYKRIKFKVKLTITQKLLIIHSIARALSHNTIIDTFIFRIIHSLNILCYFKSIAVRWL